MKLIDANNLRKEICKLFPNKMPYDYNEDDNDLGAILCDVGTIINSQPIIKVNPVLHTVIHAHWIDSHDGKTCSNCDGEIETHYHQLDINKFDYCPYCGAKMDKW